MNPNDSIRQQSLVKVQEIDLDESYSINQNLNQQNSTKSKPKQPVPWTDEENLKYAVFVEKHNTIFCSKQKRKATRIYTFLAKFLVDRTAQQCRSHFQKIIMKYKNINGFINSVKLNSGRDAYQKVFQECPTAHDALLILNENFIIHQNETQIKQKSIEVQTDDMLVFTKNQYIQFMNKLQMQAIYHANYYQPQNYLTYPQFYYFQP